MCVHSPTGSALSVSIAIMFAGGECASEAQSLPSSIVESIARASRVLLGQMVDDGHVVVGGGRVEPEVERERIGAVVVADVAAHEAAVRLVEEQRLAAHAGAEQWALDDGRRRRPASRPATALATRRCSCAVRVPRARTLRAAGVARRSRFGPGGGPLKGLRRNSVKAAGGMCGARGGGRSASCAGRADSNS